VASAGDSSRERHILPAAVRAQHEARASRLPRDAEVRDLLALKHPDPGHEGWAVRARHRFGYLTPDDYYTATVEREVTPATRWLDAGAGRHLFPFHRNLATVLAARCRRLVGVDQDPGVLANPWLHEAVQSTIEDFHPTEPFDLVTLRMVAEHLPAPESTVAAVGRLVRPGGRVVVYTVHRSAPATLASRLLPFTLHSPLKRVIWRTPPGGTFPSFYRLNTPSRLRALFDASGFDERLIEEIADCGTSGQVPGLYHAELLGWRALRAFGLRYPERCLLAVFERRR
jgi:2-polyprenyl-3-methyl-5-hydroxy-6-metoxy-1,4-benzoquinol methylase